MDILIINIPPGRKDPKVAENFPLKVKSILDIIPSHTKILFVSSTSVYGELKGEVDEKKRPKPSTASGKALLEVELKIQNDLTRDGTKWSRRSTILRLSGLVGGSRIPGRFFSGKNDVPLGEAPVNLVHRDDCIRFIMGILEQEKWGEIYNLNCDTHPSKKAFYTKACLDAGFDAPHFLLDGKDRKLINSDKIKADLKLELNHPDPMNFKF